MLREQFEHYCSQTSTAIIPSPSVCRPCGLSPKSFVSQASASPVTILSTFKTCHGPIKLHIITAIIAISDQTKKLLYDALITKITITWEEMPLT